MSVDLRRPSPTTSKGYQKVEIEAPEGKRLDTISVNWCDRTTWYPESTLVTDEGLSDSGDLTVWNSTKVFWIDTTHGKLTGERLLRPTYQAVVKVNAVEKTENSPEDTDNDYSINYATGDVTFNAALTGGDTVTATFHYESGSGWVIKPTAGKLLRLNYVEVQFSENLILNDTVIFEPYGPVEMYAPQLWDGYDPAGPYPAGTMIPLGSQTVYQTMQDYINEAEEAFPSVPKMGGTGWRGMPGPVRIFRWPYERRGTTDITATSKVEIRIQLENDIVLGGDVAVATFYGKSEDE
jgi:hypothetical protein